MKLKIEKAFKDKFTGEKYKVGSEVEFEDERGKQLLSDSRELVTQIKNTAPKKTYKKPTKLKK